MIGHTCHVNAGRLEGLDLLRGMAALMVVFLHLPIANTLQNWPFFKSYLAVDLFFMLSGYVLTRTYHPRFVAGLGAGRFMAKRVRRLWPVIAIGTVLGLVSQLTFRPLEDGLLLFALQLAIIPYFAGTAVFPLNGAIWSIFFELFANLVHGTVLWRLSRAALLRLAAAMIVITILAAEAFGNFDVGSYASNFAFGFPRVLLSYSAGCWLYLTFRDQPPFRVSAWVAPIALISFVIVGWGMGLTGWLFDLLFVVVLCPLVILAGLGETGHMRKLGAIAGDLSFPLYAVHVPIIIMVASAGWHWTVAPPLAIAFAWLVSLVTGPRASLQLLWHALPAARRHGLRLSCRLRQMRG